MNNIIFKSTYGEPHEVTTKQLKSLFEIFSLGATACEDKPKTFFKYHVVDGLTYDEFLKIVEDKKYEDNK